MSAGDTIVMVFVAFVMGMSTVFGIMKPNYDEGYCAALNGSRISAGMCNVDGKVVTVP